MFLGMRRQLVAQGKADLSPYRNLLAYERRGKSKHFSYYGFPNGCDTVFFPGCNFPGSRPEQTLWVLEQLQQQHSGIGIVLDCCGKPSHDLGRQFWFRDMFDRMKAKLLANGVNKILVACPSCFTLFREYGSPLQVASIYETLLESQKHAAASISATLLIHDACTTRHEKQIHGAVRGLARSTGCELVESAHSTKKTLCCGEGGAVHCVDSGLALSWSKLRGKEAEGRQIITYCAGCQDFLNTITPSSHIIDLIRTPEAALAGKVKVARTPVTYWNRLRLKGMFRKRFSVTINKENNSRQRRSRKYLPFAAAVVFLGFVIALQYVVIAHS